MSITISCPALRSSFVVVTFRDHPSSVRINGTILKVQWHAPPCELILGRDYDADSRVYVFGFQ